ncbi:MAG TPA: hypothetical protein VGM81_02675 [Burkholderiaceae bacterium]|jgi:hypothetical protein
MTERWKYYLLDDGRGGPYEIYRQIDNGNPFYGHREPGSIYLARSNGEWSNHVDDIRGLVNASLCGDFDPADGEISENEALIRLEQWRTTGPWPGRP